MSTHPFLKESHLAVSRPDGLGQTSGGLSARHLQCGQKHFEKMTKMLKKPPKLSSS
jgi:hypothetical protein